MKLTYAVILATSLAFWACSDDESSTSASNNNPTPSSNSNSGTAEYDCTTSDGVVVVYPKGGETFKIGETIKVVYGADPSLAGPQFIFKYRANEESEGSELTSTSAGEENPDGKTCYTQEVVLSDDYAEPSDEAIIRVVPYERQSKGANSAAFKVKE